MTSILGEQTNLAMRQVQRTLTQKEAYYLWEQAGKPEGRSQEFWLQAEDIVRQRFNLLVWVPKPRKKYPREKKSDWKKEGF